MKKKMSKYTGQEGEILSKAATQSLIKSYADLYGGESTYTKFEVIGKDVLKKLVVEGAVAVRIYNGFNGIQTCIIAVPVDKDGNEFDIPVYIPQHKDDPEPGNGAGGPKCPVNC